MEFMKKCLNLWITVLLGWRWCQKLLMEKHLRIWSNLKAYRVKLQAKAVCPKWTRKQSSIGTKFVPLITIQHAMNQPNQHHARSLRISISTLFSNHHLIQILLEGQITIKCQGCNLGQAHYQREVVGTILKAKQREDLRNQVIWISNLTKTTSKK